MTTTRDLIQRLARQLDLYRQMVLDDCTLTHPLADEARAYLSQPEPEELTDEEILKSSDQFDIGGTEDVTKGMPLDTFWDSYQPQQLIAFARAVIAADRARCGRAAVEPPIKPAHNTTQDSSQLP